MKRQHEIKKALIVISLIHSLILRQHQFGFLSGSISFCRAESTWLSVFIISLEMGKLTDTVQRKSYLTTGIEWGIVSVEFSNRSNLLVEKNSSHSNAINNSCTAFFFRFVPQFLKKKPLPFYGLLSSCVRALIYWCKNC